MIGGVHEARTEPLSTEPAETEAGAQLRASHP